uniref:Uncharacterized protein n=1 Tax=Arundo donax TaxID=35708 RepID=A0A0A9CUL8_ARUDO
MIKSFYSSEASAKEFGRSREKNTLIRRSDDYTESLIGTLLQKGAQRLHNDVIPTERSDDHPSEHPMVSRVKWYLTVSPKSYTHRKFPHLKKFTRRIIR